MRFPTFLAVVAATLLAFTIGCGTKGTVTDAASGAKDAMVDSMAAKVAGDDVAAEDVEVPQSLAVGDKAPAVYAAKWLSGDAVGAFENDRVYVVEFWATWCPPCRDSMPHLSELQEKYGDKVRFLGFTTEDEETVAGFLDQESASDKSMTWKEVVKYSLVLDKERLTSQSYMQAANQTGIPTAFIVGKDGHLEWIGHPMEIEKPLAAVVDGSFDRQEAAANFAKKADAEKAMASLREAMQSGDVDGAISVLDNMIAGDPENLDFLMTKSQILTQSGNPEDALGIIDKAIEMEPEEFGLKLMKFSTLVQAEKGEEANTLAADVTKEIWDSARELNGLAWTMATEVPAEMQDLALAKKIAERSVELENSANGLDTLARVYYEMGDLDAAIEWQTKAVEDTDDPGVKATLESYESELELKNNPAEDKDQ